MAATALILFTQGANTDVAGKAVLGDYGDFSAVTVTNGDNTDVVSWVIYLLDAPPDSVTFPPASQPQILAQAVDNTPTVAFTPDVAGTYRVMLEVVDGLDNIDRDIRCFAIPDERGFVRPPYQQNPEPLPTELPVIITVGPRPVKPDEQNYGANVRGWSGNGTAGQLDAFFRQYGDLPFQVVAVTPFTATALDRPLHLVDVVTIAGPATFNLPLSPRTGFVARIAVLGPPGDAVTIQAQGGGSVGSGSSISLVGDAGVALAHQGANDWVILTSLASAATPFSSVQYVDVATTGTSPDGTVVNPFPTIMEAVNAAAAALNAIYLTPGDYSAETLNFTGKQIELIAMSGAPFGGTPYLPTITTDSLLTLTNLGQSTGSITSTAFVYLNNTRVDGAITAVALIADAFPDINSLRILGDPIACDSSIVINGYAVSDSVSSTGGDLSFTNAAFNGTITGLSIVAQGCSFGSSAISVAAPTSKLTNCTFTGAAVFTFTADPGVLTVDGATYTSMQLLGVTVVNGTVGLAAGFTNLDRVWYADADTTFVGGDGNIETPFATMAAAIAVVEAAPGSSFFRTLLCQGLFSEATITFSNPIKISSVAPNQRFIWDGDVVFAGANIFNVWGARIEDSANTIDVSSASGTLLADRCELREITGLGGAVLTDTTATDLTLGTVILNRCTVSGLVTLGVGNTWKDSSVSGVVTITTGNLSADRCAFGDDITVTAGDLRLVNSTVGSTSTITCGTLFVDPITYEQLIADDVTIAATTIQILGSPQRVTYDEFFGGTGGTITSAASNANVGDLNWNVGDSGIGGEVSFAPSTQGMNGVYNVEASLGGIFSIYLGRNPASSGGVYIGNISWFEWRGILNAPDIATATEATTGDGRFGIGSSSTTVSFGSSGLFFESLPGTSANVRLVARLGGTETVVPTAVPANGVHDYRARRVSDGVWEFYVDGLSVGTISDANVPPDATILGFMAHSISDVDAHNVQVDRFQVALA